MKIGLNPRFVGRVFRPIHAEDGIGQLRLNPRFVGRVFRHGLMPYLMDIVVLIPDLWGESSDCNLLKISSVFNRLKDVFWIPNFLTIKNIA